MDAAQDDQERRSSMAGEAARLLGKEFDAVVVLCTRHVEGRGTVTVSKGSGNWHAQYGLVREWLIDCEEKTRKQA